MSAIQHRAGPAASRGFSLVELIGVLAIIAIMASILAPNALRSIERAEVRAEDTTAGRLGEQLLLHLRDKRTLPAEGTWHTSLATYSDLASEDIRVNRRLVPRLLVFDSTASPGRALILSSMRAGCLLPTSAGAARASFQTIWDNRDHEVPFLLGWSGWRRSVDANNNVIWTDGDYLVVERINLLPILRDELQPRTITLNNLSPAATPRASYRRNGGTAAPISPAESVDVAGLVVGDRLDLYTDSNGTTRNYSYIVGSGGRIRTIDFDGTQWKPN